MPRPCPIALTALTPTEQVLLEGALFQSAGNQLPGAVLTRDLSQALLIIANADEKQAWYPGDEFEPARLKSLEDFKQ